MSLSVIEYLGHIHKEASYLMRRLTNVNQAEFQADETLQRACTRSLEITGEAAPSEYRTNSASSTHKLIGGEWLG